VPAAGCRRPAGRPAPRRKLFAGGQPGRVGETLHGQGNLADQHRVPGRTGGAGRLPQRAGGGGQVEAAQLRHAQSAQQPAPVRRALAGRGAQRAIVEPGRVLPGQVGQGGGRGPLSPPRRHSGVPGRQGLQQVMRDHRRDGIRAAPQIAGHPGVGGEPAGRRKFQQRGLADEVIAEPPPAAGSDQPGGGGLVQAGQHGTCIALGNHGDSAHGASSAAICFSAPHKVPGAGQRCCAECGELPITYGESPWRRF